MTNPVRSRLDARLLLAWLCVACLTGTQRGLRAGPRKQPSQSAPLSCSDLERLAERHALRRVQAGWEDPVMQQFAARNPLAVAAPLPVGTDDAPRLLEAMRSGDACPTATGAMVEFILEDSPVLKSLQPELASMCSDRTMSGESRAASLRLAVKAGGPVDWVPPLLTADAPPELAWAVLDVAKAEPSIRARVMARCFVLQHVAQDDHLRVDATWFAFVHATDPSAADLLPVMLLIQLAGSIMEPLALAKEWGPETEALMEEAWSVHLEAEQCRKARPGSQGVGMPGGEPAIP